MTPERREQADRNQEARQRRREELDRDDLSDRREELQDRRDNVREEYREHQEYWYDRNVYLGMVVYPATWNSYSCTQTTVVQSGVTYIQCDNYWYQRRYVGGSISYIVVSPPSGY